MLNICWYENGNNLLDYAKIILSRILIINNYVCESQHQVEDALSANREFTVKSKLLPQIQSHEKSFNSAKNLSLIYLIDKLSF